MKIGFCFCKDAPDVEVDIRMQMIRVVMDLCPRGEMNRCLCKDDTKINFPFTLMDIMNCEPKRVTKIVYYVFDSFVYVLILNYISLVGVPIQIRIDF